ncbi:MAG: LysR family transcriptional regulator [Phycisphaeraceae bacterium]|nr:LysR family transcriptional regulator [Phycisphaeraceae bacterium]
MMRIYCEVARQQSFSKAAAAMGLTQSAVSQRVMALEKELNLQLFDRSVRPLALTAEGEVYLKEARILVERYDKLIHRVTQMQHGLCGQVVVETIYSAGIDLVNRAKQAFEEMHPQVTVEIQYKRPDEIHDGIKHGRCDLGVVSYPRHWRDVGVVHLRNEPMAVICRPDHELAAKKKVDASELGAWPLVAFESNLPVGRNVKRYLRQHGIPSGFPRLVGEFDNIDTMRHALAEVPDSYAILPKCSAQKQIDRGSLVAVELIPPLMRPLGVIYDRQGTRGIRGGRVGREFTPAVQGFLDYLLEHVSKASEGSTTNVSANSELQGVGSV